MEERTTQDAREVIAAADQAIVVTERLLHVARVAERLGVTPATVRNWIRRGIIPSTKKPYRIPASAVTAREAKYIR